MENPPQGGYKADWKTDREADKGCRRWSTRAGGSHECLIGESTPEVPTVGPIKKRPENGSKTRPWGLLKNRSSSRLNRSGGKRTAPDTTAENLGSRRRNPTAQPLEKNLARLSKELEGKVGEGRKPRPEKVVRPTEKEDRTQKNGIDLGTQRRSFLRNIAPGMTRSEKRKWEAETNWR